MRIPGLKGRKLFRQKQLNYANEAGNLMPQ